MDATYVFSVRFRLSPDAPVSVEPATFETTLYRAADPPGEDGWLFFRDNLWRGEVNDPVHARELAEDALGVPVESVEYRRFDTDEEYYDALKAAISEDLELFKADNVSEALTKYFGSSVEVES
ncbi:LWR-salt protein [Natronoarchaeum mannanilyticum]|uniref:LWR-salt protein n=1 Tax=Natronoarchaeum mannanilyticum TaxID=926360 RepID=A0AAV3T9M0_9EURY